MCIAYAVRMVVTDSDTSVCLMYMEATSMLVHGGNKRPDKMT